MSPQQIPFGNTNLSPDEIEALYQVFREAKGSSQVTAGTSPQAVESLWGKIEMTHREYAGAGN